MSQTAARSVIIVGAGLIGAKRIAALDARQRLTAIVDTDVSRAQQLAQPAGVAAGSELAPFLDSAEPGGLVIVATTHASLAPLALEAVTGGQHVLIEKPGARRASELRPVLAAAAERDRVVRVGYNHRFHPAIRRLRAEVGSGDYGQVQVVRARYGHGGRPGYETEWRANRELSGGGELLDQGSHLIDLTRAIAGDLTDVHGFLDTLNWPMEVEDNAFVTARLPDRARAWLHASWTEWKNIFSLEVSCKTAKFEVEGLGGSYGPESFRRSFMTKGYGPPEITTVQFPPGDDSWALEMTDIEENILGSGASGATGADALANLEAIAQIYDQQSDIG